MFKETDEIGGLPAGGETAPQMVPTSDEMPLSAPIAAAVEAVRARRFCLKMQGRCDRATDAMIVTEILKMPHDTAKGDRSAWFKRAADIREAVEAEYDLITAPPKHKGSLTALRKRAVLPDGVDIDTADRLDRLKPLVVSSKVARSSYDRLREDAERRMRDAATQMPAFAWWSSIKGVDALGLALVVGLAGNDLSAFANPGKLWKRLGLAPYNGQAGSTWRRGTEGKLTAEEWVKLGYSAARLGELFGVVTVPLAMQKAKNEFGAIYEARRAHTAETHPDWTKGHSHNDACRFITKRLVRELWRHWRADCGMLDTEIDAPLLPLTEFAIAAE